VHPCLAASADSSSRRCHASSSLLDKALRQRHATAEPCTHAFCAVGGRGILLLKLAAALLLLSEAWLRGVEGRRQLARVLALSMACALGLLLADTARRIARMGGWEVTEVADCTLRIVLLGAMIRGSGPTAGRWV
jgi:hypothetical protein